MLNGKNKDEGGWSQPFLRATCFVSPISLNLPSNPVFVSGRGHQKSLFLHTLGAKAGLELAVQMLVLPLRGVVILG